MAGSKDARAESYYSALAVGQKVHAMYHAGAARDRVRLEVAQGYARRAGRDWDKLPWLNRRLMLWMARGTVASAYGPQFCDPNARHRICWATKASSSPSAGGNS